jgi:hypothetical protein
MPCFHLSLSARGHVPSLATIMTRECSASLIPGSNKRIKPFSTTPSTASGRRRPRCDSTGEKGAWAGRSRGARGGSEAICSSSARRATLRLSSAGGKHRMSPLYPLRLRRYLNRSAYPKRPGIPSSRSFRIEVNPNDLNAKRLGELL